MNNPALSAPNTNVCLDPHTTKSTMLFVGHQWLGSNSRALAMAFRDCGWIVDIIDPLQYVPRTTTLASKLVRKVSRSILQQSLSEAMRNRVALNQPDVLFVYKGSEVTPSSLEQMRSLGVHTDLFYPDVSLHTHGRDIPLSVQHYDTIFTTKSFGVSDLKALGARRIEVVLHASDPDLHRPLSNSLLPNEFTCDVSFIGTWSPHKEKLLSDLVARTPDLRLKIWGSQWEKCNTSNIEPHLEHRPLFGDLYPAAIQSAKINLGLLSEQRYGASNGDLTTSRTFNIPACKAFMIHERNDEVLACFEEGKEIECFGDTDELAEKIAYYLKHDSKREEIAAAGYQRCEREHRYHHRAAKMTAHIRSLTG